MPNNNTTNQPTGSISSKRYICPICAQADLDYAELAEHTAIHADEEDARIERAKTEVIKSGLAAIDERIDDALASLSELYQQRRELDPYDHKLEIPSSFTPAAFLRFFF